jgi:tetratricopeptide (TPR) repeat protein
MMKKKTPPKQFQIKELAAHARMIYNSSVLEYVPYLLIYPLQGHALPLIIIFSLILWITLGNMLGLAAFMIIIPGTLKYAYGVLEQTILGYATPPPLTFDMWNWANQRPVKQLFYLLFIVGIFQIIQTKVGNIPAYLFLAIGIFLTPASAAVIANQNNLLAALNPLKLFILVKEIGMIYIVISLLFALVVLFSLLIFLGIPLIGRIIPQFGWRVNNGFLLLLIVMLDFYLLIMMFHLLGFVIYHRRDALGFEAVFSPEREEKAQQEAKDKQFEALLDEIYWLTRQEGKQEEAVETLLAKLLPTLEDKLDSHQKLFERVSLWETNRVALVHGQYYLSLLLRKKQFAKALAIYQACLTLNAQFEPKTPYQILPLAKQAFQEKQYSFTLSLLQDFLSRYPEHPDSIEMKLLMAKLLTERFERFDEAKAIMAQLLENKAHRLYPDIKKYAQFLVKYSKGLRP